MPKRTLVQTILGRPSQTYYVPVENKAYHSTKPELFRLYASRALVPHDCGADGPGHKRPAQDSVSQPQVQDVLLLPPPHACPPLVIDTRPVGPAFGLASAATPVTQYSRETADNSDDSDSDPNESFFTPDTSPRTSVVFSASSPAATLPLLISKATDRPDSPPPPPPSISSMSLSSTVATSSESLFVDSVFSSASVQRSDSTRFTSPTSSETGRLSRRRITLQPHRSPSSSDTGLDPSWSKDVRWLIPPSSSKPPPNTPRFDTRSRSLPSKRLTKMLAQTTPSITTSMAALLEEDESPASSSTAHRRTYLQTPRSSVVIVDARGPRSSTSLSLHRANTQLTPVPESRRTYGSAADISYTSYPSAIPQAQDGTWHGRESEASPSHPRSRSASSPSQPASRRRSSSASQRHFSLSISKPASYSPTLPSHGTPGYTSLVLPRAPPPPTLPIAPAIHSGLDGRIDLTLSGIAQTTMATVEVVRGLSTPGGNRVWSTLSKRRTIGRGLKSESSGGNKQLSPGDTPLAFTSHRAPPSYVGSGSVLVQVWAVGVDDIDRMLVAEKSGLLTDNSKGKGKAVVGYIPGRSFVGRVLECGWEVRGEDVRKGEWVVGLLDVRKSGALAEFVVVDRHRILRIPYPRMQSPEGQASRSPSSPSSNTSSSLTLQEYALLPLCGVLAQRAVRTCLSAIPRNVKRRRALVLRGHDGVGAFATQMFIQNGWHVIVHAPLADREPVHCSSGNDTGSSMSVETRVRTWGADGVVFDDGEPGAAIRVLEMLAEEGDVFDAIVDTVGGRDVWEAGSRLLKAGDGRGVFTTLVGDVVGRAVPSAGDHFRASIRSLRRGHSGGKGRVGDGNGSGGDQGKVQYAWVSIAQDVDWDGADIRESLRAVLALALEGAARPWPGIVVPFERTPEIFVDGLGGSSTLDGGKTAVVKVVG